MHPVLRAHSTPVLSEHRSMGYIPSYGQIQLLCYSNTARWDTSHPTARFNSCVIRTPLDGIHPILRPHSTPVLSEHRLMGYIPSYGQIQLLCFPNEWDASRPAGRFNSCVIRTPLDGIHPILRPHSTPVLFEHRDGIHPILRPDSTPVLFEHRDGMHPILRPHSTLVFAEHRLMGCIPSYETFHLSPSAFLLTPLEAGG
jgi:hypothetical protein